MIRNVVFTKAELAPVCLETFDRLQAALPPELAGRLTCNRVVRTHGTKGNHYLFNVWDRAQNDLLHPNYFCYCFNYCTTARAKGEPDGVLHLWINTIRLYRNRERTKACLEAALKKHCPAGFQFQAAPRFVEVKTAFFLPERLGDFPAIVLPRYVRLLRALHPALLPIIEQMAQPLTQAERGALAARGIRHAQGTRLPADELRQFTRSVPPSWRRQILANWAYRCATCGENLQDKEAHMDHILPFSKGGPTTLDNLQPLCRACNLKKGNRLPAPRAVAKKSNLVANSPAHPALCLT